MRKALGLLMMLALLVGPVATVLHLAEHDFKEHTHDGHACTFYLKAQEPAAAPPAPPVCIVPTTTTHQDLPWVHIVSRQPHQTRPYPARAPPAIS